MRVRREVIGHVGVDSGLVMVVDPCYVLGDREEGWQKWQQPSQPTYDDVMEELEKASIRIPYKQKWYEGTKDEIEVDSFYRVQPPAVEPWGRDLGIVVGTYHGDGGWPVIAEFDADDDPRYARPLRIIIDFDPPYEDEDIEPTNAEIDAGR